MAATDHIGPCTRCGGSGREVLALGERAVVLCFGCDREAKSLLNAFIACERIVCGEPQCADEPEAPITTLIPTLFF
ncbi:MAG: hypothetical protein H0T51_02315 [Pirellulales bacterium]|nr:hypothetical protein [Pirellulales bacterium]